MNLSSLSIAPVMRCAVFVALRRHVLAAVGTSLLCLATTGVHAADLGTVGPVYPINEPNFLTEIIGTLGAKEQSGELARFKHEWKKRVLVEAQTPAPVDGMARVTVSATRYHDPTLRVTENIVNERGEVIMPAGTTVNPADYVGLKSPLLFFDARDAAQLAYARGRVKEPGTTPPRLILTGGSPIPLIRELGVPVYFDQRGYITSRLKIRRVPSLISQEGRLLRIDEIPVGGSGDARRPTP